MEERRGVQEEGRRGVQEEGRRGVEDEGRRGLEEEGRGWLEEERRRGVEDEERGVDGEEDEAVDLPLKRRIVRFKPSHTISEISDEEDVDEIDDFSINDNEYSEESITESEHETDNDISSDSDSEIDSEWTPSQEQYNLEIEDIVLDQAVELDRDFENGGISKPFIECTKETKENKIREMSNQHKDYDLKLAFSRKFLKDHEEKERKRRIHRKRGEVKDGSGGGGERGGEGGGQGGGEGGGKGGGEEGGEEGEGGGEKGGEGGGAGAEGGGDEERSEEEGVWRVEEGDLRSSRELAFLVMIKDANLSMGQYKIVRFVLEDRALLGESNSTLPSWERLTEEVHTGCFFTGPP